MKARLRLLLCFFFFSVFLTITRGEEAAVPGPVVIDFFYEPGCPECLKVRETVLPELESRFQGFYRLNQHDVSIATNVPKLIAYQARLGVANANEPVSMVVDYTFMFSGLDAIQDGVADRVEKNVEARMSPEWREPEPIIPAGPAGSQAAESVKGFVWLAVMCGGLADGINPCAMSTLVFFMSLLAVAKVRGQGLVLMGVSFCAASFLVYTALGFGLLHALHAMDGFPVVRHWINQGMLAILGVLAVLSFRDAWRFKRSGNPDDVTLQMPGSVKKRIHAVMRTRLRNSGLMVGGLLVGGAVTMLESVCTGQVYIPTLVVVIRSEFGTMREWLFLLLYNLMFVTPLIVVFGLTYYGLKTEKLLDWSKRNVVFSKVVLGLLFLAMMAGLMVL